MIYLKWLLLAIVDWLLVLTLPTVAPVVIAAYLLLPWTLPTALVALYLLMVAAIPTIALFTKEQPYGLRPYKWGWMWGTWDNPPQGDRGYVEKRAPFPGVTTGVKGYINRVKWMIRNPFYGYAKFASLRYDPSYVLTFVGDENISDKHKRPGYYFAKLKSGDKLVGFEFYCVIPWSETRNFRCRLGWKLMTSKFKEYGFAQLVNTANPFDGYGDSTEEKK